MPGNLLGRSNALAAGMFLGIGLVHMLPEALAAGACSLVPDQDRLTMTAILDYDDKGRIAALEVVLRLSLDPDRARGAGSSYARRARQARAGSSTTE